VDGGNHLGIRMGREHAVSIHRLAPLVVDPNDSCPAPPSDLTHARPKESVDSDHCHVAVGHGVHESGLHPA
jgi:hypothetical protein